MNEHDYSQLEAVATRYLESLTAIKDAAYVALKDNSAYKPFERLCHTTGKAFYAFAQQVISMRGRIEHNAFPEDEAYETTREDVEHLYELFAAYTLCVLNFRKALEATMALSVGYIKATLTEKRKAEKDASEAFTALTSSLVVDFIVEGCKKHLQKGKKNG